MAVIPFTLIEGYSELTWPVDGLVLMSGCVGEAMRLAGPDPAMPSSQVPTALSKVSFEQRLNEQLPLDLPFKDENGPLIGDYRAEAGGVAFVYMSARCSARRC
jgi:hypothetical protein